MENDGKEIMLNTDKNNDNEVNIDIFNIDYENQNVENNTNFNQWKESINNKYKGKGNICKCPFENHYFYGEEKEYNILCPSCNKNICYFCLTPVVDAWYAICCSKRKLYAMHYKGKIYSNPEERDGHYYDAEYETIMIFIPGISLIFLVGIFF